MDTGHFVQYGRCLLLTLALRLYIAYGRVSIVVSE